MHALTHTVRLLALIAAQTVATFAAADSGIYNQLVDASVWIVNSADNSAGSGVVIDAERRIVLTNYHVVGKSREVRVFFAAFDGEDLVTDRDVYRNNFNTLQQQGMAFSGRVLGLWKERDLALVQLDDLPAGLTAVPLAADSAQPGETVHSVGNPGVSDGLWVYCSGNVRQIFPINMTYADGQRVRARVLATTSPINPGDSGGGIVNDRGELVGVNCASSNNGRLMSYAIDIREIKAFMESLGGTSSKPELGTIAGWPN